MIALSVLLVLAYLIGALPSAVVFGKLFKGIDIRQHGSGNAGGTNAWRVMGWRVGLPVMVADVAKGALAAGLISRIPLGALPVDLGTMALLCGIAAVIGHVFPVYLKFRGGKGVATGGGMLLVTAPLPAAIALGVFALLLTTFGRVSLGSVVAAVSLPVSVFLIDRLTATDYPLLLLILTSLLALFILVTHRANIRRLIRGEEKAFPKLQIWRKAFKRRK